MTENAFSPSPPICVSMMKQEKKKKKKKNALIICASGNQFWTTQSQFWQWSRERILVKTADNPLTGQFVRENEEFTVLISNTVLNLNCPNHLREALWVRKLALKRT